MFMEVTLCKAEIEDREILANLIEKYEYDFSQYDVKDVNALGLYGYKYLDFYWTEESRHAYFIRVDGALAGFVMINNFPEAEDRKTDFVISEFFVMHKYRKKGVGKKAFFMAADLHRGNWQLKRHPKNTPAVLFWDSAVNEYTNGNFELISAYPNTEYQDGTPGDVFFFSNISESRCTQ
jgi:predicted acetyltransferase